MTILNQLRENKGTISSALGKELAKKVLEGDSDILKEAVALTNYESGIKKFKNIRAGAAKIVEKVAEENPKLLAPYLKELIPALSVPEPQTKWMTILAFGYCAKHNPSMAIKSIDYAEKMIYANQGTCLSGAAEVALGHIGSIGKDETKKAFQILSCVWPDVIRNDIDEIMEAFMLMWENLEEDNKFKIKELVKQYEDDPQKSTQKRVKKILKK